MDWKILTAVLLFLVGFTVYRSCSDDGVTTYDEVLEAKQQEGKETQQAIQAKEKQARIEKLQQEARQQINQKAVAESVFLESEHFIAEFTTLGGALKSYQLKDAQYKQKPRDWSTGELKEVNELEQINLVTTNPAEKFWTAYPLRLHFTEGLEGILPKAYYEVVRKSKTEVVMKYEQPGQPIVIYKKFQLASEDNPYQFWMTLRFVNKSDKAVSFRPSVMQSGFQPESEAASGMFTPQPNLQTITCNGKNDFFQEPLDEMEETYYDTGVKFAGVGNNYFVNAMMPRGDYPTACELRGYGGSRRTLVAWLQWGEIDLEAGKDVVLNVQNYMGPKKYQVLQSVGSRLEETADYGIFEPISKVLLWMLHKFHGWVLNWGLAIILLTIIIKVALIPLTNKSFKSSNAMKELKPEMDKINEKFKDDPQKKQQEIMAMYKAKGVNPMGGCLPMLLQMPIWFALFRTLRSSPELYRAPFFGWIDDLSAADPYYVTPLLLGVLMFLQQKMMPMAGDNQQMKMMMYMMPVMFTVMMIFLPSGLTLYIMVNTVLSILHQWLLKKKTDAATA